MAKNAMKAMKAAKKAMKAAADRIRKKYDYFDACDWENFTEHELYEHWDFIKEMKMMGTVFPDFETNAKRRKNWVRTFKSQMTSYTFRYANGQKTVPGVQNGQVETDARDTSLLFQTGVFLLSKADRNQ